MYVNIHTHQVIDNESIIKIINDFGEEKILHSYGIHPWDAASFQAKHAEVEESQEKMSDVSFIGEVGLDKIHKESFHEQEEIFYRMIRLSETYKKVTVIHCVKAYSEIIEFRKKTKATMPWIIHGFNSSVETARQLLSHGIYISLGDILYRNENQAVKLLKDIPCDRLFLETDVSGRDIRDIYSRAATLAGCETDFLCKQIFDNFNKIFTF